MSTFPPRQATKGQRITYASGNGTLRRLEAAEVDGRWVIQPETNGDEAAVRRHRLPVDEELAAKQAAEQAEAEKLAGKALDERAAELEIEGRGSMSADQKRKAIAKREAELAEAPGAEPTNDTAAGQEE
jgi:hypothetical protein